MEEIEVPLEQAHETLQEAAERAAENANEKWIGRVALSSAILAAFAAVAALMSGHHANEAMIEQIKSSDHWAYYQAKGIKASLLSSKMQLLVQLQKGENSVQSGKDEKKLEEYQHEQEEIKKEAEAAKASSETHLNSHQVLAKAVTFFQVAIAIGAISALTRKRRFWYVSLGFGGLGLLFFILGLK